MMRSRAVVLANKCSAVWAATSLPSSSSFLRTGTRQQLAKVTINSIVLDGVNIAFSDEITLLGIVIDREMTFATRSRRLAVAVHWFYQLRQLRTIRRTLTLDAVKTLVHAAVTSHLTTVIASWSMLLLSI